MRKLLLSISFLFCVFCIANAQSKQLEKATKLYKEKRYTEAAKFYELALEEKTTIGVKTKLANCYRVNNKMNKAEKLYAEIVQSEKAKSKSFFYYGEALMSNGKYDEAKKWFKEYEILEPDDEKGRLMIEACDLVKTIEPHFKNIKTTEFPFNSDADDSSPVMLGDNLVFSSDRSSGIAKQKSGWTGRNYINLFFSSLTDTSYTEPKVFSGKLSDSNKNTGNASFTEDGNEIFFTRNGVELSNKSVYNLSIFRAEATGDLRWKNVNPLPFSSKQYNFMHPAISPDGKLLFFVSDKPKGQGGTDIWVSSRTKDGWSRTQNLGVNVNTAANEGFPFVDKDGKLYFCSKGHPGFGGFDIFVTEQDKNGEWTTPINLGSPINSPRDDISISIAKNKKGGLFTSNRSGGDDDIYLFEILDGQSMTENYVVKQDKPMVVPVNETIPAKIEKAEIVEKIKVEKKEEIIEELTAPTVDINMKEEVLEKEKIKEELEEETPESLAETVEKEIVKKEVESVVSIETPTPPKYKIIEAEENKMIPETPIYQEPILEEKEEVEVVIDSLTKIDLSTVKASATKNISVEENSIPDFYYLKEAAFLIENGELEEGQIFRLNEIFYDFEVYQVTPEVKIELDKIVAFLQKNEGVHVELGAHTESPGNDKNNLILSRYRAEAAVAYLVKKGIGKERLSSKGYGETQILNHCVNDVECTSEEHAFNQRLELRIMK